LNQIKAESTLASDQESTVLKITSAFARDRVAGSSANTITAITHANNKIPTVFTKDTTPAVLEEFTFDVSNGKLTTYWSEAVKNFDKTAFHFVDKQGGRRRRLFASGTGNAVHPGIICDASGINPIVGPRFHLIGGDYDLCESEFLKLSQKEQLAYEVIEAPGLTPQKFVPQ
jgi:hypothetical protein